MSLFKKKDQNTDQERYLKYANSQGKVEKQVTLSNEALTRDANKDGVADYLQRENYASIINTNKEFMKWESDVETEIEQYIMGMKGYEFDVNNAIWKPVSPPLMNDAGINFMKTMLRTVINKHSINTFLTGNEAHSITLSHSLSVVKTLEYRKNLYSIHLADLNAIIEGFDNLSYIILSRSVDDKQRNHTDNRLNMAYSANNSPGGG